jgi:RimJ/RimL family protein N-acetyltransferase
VFLAVDPALQRKRNIMIQITPDRVTSSIRSLFRTSEPQARRCFAVLDGVAPAGKIIVDHPVEPTWAVVQEVCDNSLYLGGKMDPSAFAAVFAALRQEGDVLVGMWPDDPRIALLPPDPDYDGLTLEFYDRPIGEGLDPYLRQMPADCTIRRLDRDLIMRTEWGPGDVTFAGGIDIWEKTCMGYCLMRGDEILSEATVGAPAIGLYEPGVFTQEAHRGRGYGTIVVARLIQEIEAMGGQSYWNCAKQNLASAAIARKLGYRVEKEYRCMAWGKTSPE